MSASPARDKALDCTKGIAILAVVLFHVTRGFVAAGELEDTPALRFADTLAYGFHVQTFFLIAGYLAYPKAWSTSFQIQRHATLYWSYLLWSGVSWGLAFAFANEVNNPLAISDLITIPFYPIQHFWFLLVLMGGTAMLCFLRSGPSLLLGAAACLTLAPETIRISLGMTRSMGLLTLSLGWLPFILIGAWLRHVELRPPATLAGGAVGVSILGIAAWAAVRSGFALTNEAAFPMILAGCYACYVAGSLASRMHLVAGLLARLGTDSLAIYLLHVIACAGVRIIIGKFAPDLPVTLAVMLSFGAGLAGPLLLLMAARRLGIAPLLGLGPLKFRLSANQ